MNIRTIAGWLTMLLLGALPVAAQSASGQQPTTRQRDLVLDLPAAEPATKGIPRGYALIIGISDYANLDNARQLEFAESDARAMYRTLISQQAGAFPAENVRLLLGRQATLANVRRELEEWLPAVAQPSDRVIVYFAGHGFVKNGVGYLAPHDVHPDQLETTGYPMKRLGDVLANRVKARWKVLLTDACHSGKVNAETTNEALDKQFSSLPSNFLTLTATTEREASHEDPRLSTGFGLYTYFLTQAWTGNADNDPCDGRVTADELINYVRTNVRRYARDRSLSQTPTAYGDYDPEMLLGVSPACLTTGPASTESLLGTAIVEVNLDDVDVYVDDQLVGRVSQDKPLVLPRLTSGLHEFKGARTGYEPDVRQIMIAPGQEKTVTLRIRYVRVIKKSAAELNSQGERLLTSRQSSTLNIVEIVDGSQSESDLRRARDFFTRALADDPGFSKAAFNLGQTHHLLGDQAASLRAYRRAIEIDPGSVDARINLAGVYVEQGDADQAIRELTEAARLETDNDRLHAMMARAYWDKAAWAQAVTAATTALARNPSNDQAHLWRADALRQLAVAEQLPDQRARLFMEARDHYRQFLSLTNFESSVGGKILFFAGISSRTHADRQESYRNQRKAGFLGLCITERNVGLLLRAREYCQRALKYDANAPMTYFLLGNINRDLYNVDVSCDHLIAAARNYAAMVKLNSDLQEAKNARNYLEQIGGVMPQLGCRAG